MTANKNLMKKLAAVRKGRPDDVQIHASSPRSLRAIDIGRPIFINEASGPIEYLAARSELASDKDVVGMGGVRFHTALRLRELMEGAQIKSLRSPDLEAIGRGSGKAGNIPAYKLDCMAKIADLRNCMPKPWVFEMLIGIVWGDQWHNLKQPEISMAPTIGLTSAEKRKAKRKRAEKLASKRRARRQTIETLLWSLDVAAVRLGYLDKEFFRLRWGGQPSPQEAEAHRHNQESKA